MKKIIYLICFAILSTGIVFANDAQLTENNNIQNKLNSIGTNILNSNKIDKRIIFIYNDKDKKNFLNENKNVTKREVIVYSDTYKNIETDDEIAAYVSREIAAAVRSYDGIFSGWLSSLKMKAAPKKYELVYDKLAVDYMVNSGYNPLGLIVYINKTFPEARQDKISFKNLTSKRLAYIYEKIYNQYPSFLVNNTYINNKYYQNFLLTSQDDRKRIAKESKNFKVKGY